MFRLNINNSFMLIFPTIIVAMLFTYTDIKAQSINISLANAYSNHPLLFSERIGDRVLSEDVAEALSGWKPQVYLDGSMGKNIVTTTTSTTTKTDNNLPVSVGIVISKNLGALSFNSVLGAESSLVISPKICNLPALA